MVRQITDAENALIAPIINLLENCVTAHMSLISFGTTGTGKTELIKYLSTFIPDNELAGIYEENSEIHYRTINPDKMSVNFRVDKKKGYSYAIEKGLRHNVDWILMSESRGEEVVDLVKALSTGCYCMTTMHLEDGRSLGDRMYNMAGGRVTERFINSVYKYVKVGVLLERNKKQERSVKQVCFYTREDGANKCSVVYEDGEFYENEIPESIRRQFEEYGVTDPYQ